MNKLFFVIACVLTPVLSINASEVELEKELSNSLNTQTMFYIGFGPIITPCPKVLLHSNSSGYMGYRIRKNDSGIDCRLTLYRLSAPYAKASMAYQYYFSPRTYVGFGASTGKIGKSSLLSADPFVRLGFQSVSKEQEEIKSFVEIQLHPLHTCARTHAKSRLITHQMIDNAIETADGLRMPTRHGEEWLEQLANREADEHFREQYVHTEILEEKKSIFPCAKYIPTITISYGVGF